MARRADDRGGWPSGGRESGGRESGLARVSGLDVFSNRVGRFLATFFGLWAMLAGLLSYARIVTADEPTTWPAVVIIVIIAAAVTVGVAFPLAVGIVEGIPMVLANLLKKRYREEGREEGRDEGFDEGVEKGIVIGRQEANADWEAWYERGQQAARAGEPFDEPPPTHNGRRPRDMDTDG